MYTGNKTQYRAVLSLMTVIIVSAALTGFAIFLSWRSNSLLLMVLSALLLIGVAFLVSLLFYRIYTRPMIRLWQRGEHQNLLKTRKQFADFMDDLPLGVFIKDNQSRAVYLNNYMDQIFGKSNCIGKTPYNIFDKTIAGRVVDEDRRVLAGENLMVEEVLTDKNGKERVYMTHKFCMRDENTDTRIGGISIEITHRREVEYKLRILSKAIRNSPVCVTITDPGGHIEYVNPAFVNSTGYSFAEVLGENMRIINSGKHEESFFREMWTKINHGRDWQGEILNKKKDGTYFWELVNISSVKNREGEITHFVAIRDDISKRKQMEDALLKAKEKAEDSDRLKSAFLANMSHEIRTPMNAIVGLSSLLADPDLPLSERDNFSEIINENSNVLLQLIDDIVDISKIEAGQIIMRPSECNVISLLDDIYDSFRHQFNDKKGKLLFRLHKEKPSGEILTFADTQRLRQVITNLISNALKFTEKGIVEFGYSMEDDRQILFYVKDTGIGISADKHELVFDRFRQADDGETRDHRGAGLGLSISKSLVELMGGSIWVDSKKGSGSCFYFTIPYKPVSLTPKDITNKDKPAGHPELGEYTVLVVEDLEVNFKLIKAMLKKTGAEIIWAQTGKKAREILKNNSKLSLVLLDLNMPDINGFDILKEIKKSRRELPVIIQTAYAMNGEKERCTKAGCDSFITKPVQMDQLVASISHCILKKDKVRSYAD